MASRGVPSLSGDQDITPNPTAQTWRSAVNIKDEIARGMREWGMYCYLPVQYLTAFRFAAEGWDVMAETRDNTDHMPVVVLLTLQRLAVSPPSSIVLVTCPTWSLTTSVTRVLLEVGRYTDVTCFDCSRQESAYNIARSARVLVGTPAQLLRKMQENQFHPGQVCMLVSYQVDEIVLQQAQNSLVEIFRWLPRDHHMLFTATKNTPAVVDLLYSLRGSPFVLSNYDNPGPVETMRQHCLSVDDEDSRFDLVFYILEDMGVENVTVLCSSQASVEAVQRLCQAEKFGSMLIPFSTTSSQVVPPADAETRVFITQHLTDENPFDVPKILIIYDCSSALRYREIIDMFGNVRPDGVPIVLVAPAQGNEFVKALEDVTSRHIKELPHDVGWQNILF